MWSAQDRSSFHRPTPELTEDSKAQKSIKVNLEALGKLEWQELARGLGPGEDPTPKCPVLKMQWKAPVTWLASIALTLVCRTASGSIFFLMARLLTVMVSAFTGCREKREKVP